MTTTAQHSAAIRAALKARGLTSKDVSIRTDNYSGGSSIRIEVKNPAVSLATVEALATDHESIRRDQFGEILSGGNRFVFVAYADDALKYFSQKYAPAVRAAVDTLGAADRSSLIPVDGTPYMIGRSGLGWLSVWSDRHMGEAYDADGAARIIGAYMAGR